MREVYMLKPFGEKGVLYWWMLYLDAIILSMFERTCHRFQRLTGRTNVWIAVQLTNLSIIVYFVWAGMYAWSRDGLPRLLAGLFCAGLLYVLTQTIFKVPIETHESHAYRRVAKGLRNPRRLRDALLRVSFLTLGLLLAYPVLLLYLNPVLRAYLELHFQFVILTYALIVLTTVVLYLLACDPMPPCVGRLPRLIRGAAPSRVAVSDPDRA